VNKVLITQPFDSRVPTRYFLGKPRLDDEIQISIEEGKMLIIKLLAIGTLDEKRGTREVFFEMNGEVRASQIEDRSAAVEHVSREKATKEPGSVGSPLSGVVVEVRVHEGSAVKAGDPLVVMSASESCPQDCLARQGDGVLTNPVSRSENGVHGVSSRLGKGQEGACCSRRQHQPERFGRRDRSLRAGNTAIWKSPMLRFSSVVRARYV
jgi:hypothetical protein